MFAGAKPGSRELEVRVDGRLAAEIVLREVCEGSVAEAVADLEAAGLRVMSPTGDGAERAAAIPTGDRLVRQSPVDKHVSVGELQRAGGKVLFVID